MTRRSIAVVIPIVLTGIVLGATVFREQVARAAPGIQDVFVTNSTRAPVPVREQGTADVNVTNAPLAVRESGETPVQRELAWTIGVGCFATDTYTVPAGKYLRIEQVTFDQSKPQDYIHSFSVSTDFVKHYLEHDRNGVSQLVRLYATPGSTVGFPLHICGFYGATFFGSFGGVLIDAS